MIFRSDWMYNGGNGKLFFMSVFEEMEDIIINDDIGFVVENVLDIYSCGVWWGSGM